MKLLVLGGTQFLGRAVVEAALERGHELTLFNRGQTNPSLFPEVETVRGDRATDPFPSGRWDAIVDTSGYVPAVIRRSAEALRRSVELYLFVSTISVYADLSRGPSEDAPREAVDDLPADRLLDDYSNYGALKALCEDVVLDVFGDGALIVRPGLIVGPYDPTGRFTYWPHRVARGGDVVAPAPPGRKVQFVDVRDLGRWLVALCGRGEPGVSNATHPGVTWGELLACCIRVTESTAELVWIPDEFLLERGVGQWMELPLWIADPDAAGLHEADVSRAVAAGLAFRPLDETVRATLELAGTTGDAGLEPGRERRLVEEWRRR